MSTSLPETISPTGSFTPDVFAQHLAAQTGLPDWWLDAKRTAWAQFQSSPLPTIRDEAWRFSTRSGIKLDGYAPASASASAQLPAHASDLPCAARLVFSNNALAQRTALAADLAARGVIVEPLRDALVKHGDLVRRYLNQQHTNLGADKFRALHTALAHDGVFIYVPAGVEVPTPIAVVHQVTGAGATVFPHTLVVAEANARATIAEFFTSAEADAVQLASGVNDLFAGPGAQLNYIAAQAWSSQTLAFQHNAITADRDARILALNVHLGGRQARHESHSRLIGPGAHSEMLALTVAQGTQEFDQRTLQTHQAPHTSSNLLYKNALLDSARTIFSGLIVVEPDAQKTDAYQSNRNLMLSDTAEANSLPGLEIQANDVRCSHGATTSRLDPEQEFYLLARGIPKAQAAELLLFGFFEKVLGEIPHEGLYQTIRALIQTKLKK